MARADKEYKIILVGDPAVGKTAFVRRFITNQFEKGYRATLGGPKADFQRFYCILAFSS
eukprot:m.41334 g.41334  ORF g.41334 m.41334 type:complete len:59 (+) comp33135_c0_seq1:276-452(+)